MKTAKFIRDCNGFTGKAKLYELSEPVKYEYDTKAQKTNFVVVSATVAPFSGAETYIFPANANGNVLDWGELNGSYRGGLSHTEALKRAGFSVV